MPGDEATGTLNPMETRVLLVTDVVELMGANRTAATVGRGGATR